MMGCAAISAGRSKGPVMGPVMKVQSGDHLNSQQEYSCLPAHTHAKTGLCTSTRDRQETGGFRELFIGGRVQT